MEQTQTPYTALSPLGRAHLDELLAGAAPAHRRGHETQDRLGGLLDAVVGLVGDLDLDSVLERLVTIAGQLIGARYAALGVLGTGPDRRLRGFVTYGLTGAEREQIGDLPRGHGILGVLIDRPEPLRLNRIQDACRLLRLPREPSAHGDLPRHPDPHPRQGLRQPVPHREAGSGGFTDQDEELVVALAAAAGVVIENARLYEEAAAGSSGSRQQPTSPPPCWVRSSRTTRCTWSPTERGRWPAPTLPRCCSEETTTSWSSKSSPAPRPKGWSGLSVPVEDSLAGTVLRSGQMLVIDDLSADVHSSPDVIIRHGQAAIGPLVVLPLRTAAGVDGVLTMGWTSEHEQRFRDIDMQLPAAFAEQAALALHVARMQQNQALLAVFEDRDRIGRDLHDLVIQRLFAVGLALEGTASPPGHRNHGRTRVGRGRRHRRDDP